MASLFFQQGIELARSSLPEVNDVHGRMGRTPMVNAHNIRFAEVGLQNRSLGGVWWRRQFDHVAGWLQRAPVYPRRGEQRRLPCKWWLFPRDTIFMRHTPKCFQIRLENRVLTSTY